MRLIKRTYALPLELLDQFENAVEAGRRSQVIADVLNKWLEHRRQELLRKEVIEGCKAMGDIYLEVEREYHSLEKEVTDALYPDTKTRRHRSSTARSHRRI